MTTAAIIQARMGSTRLPGKVLMDLAGRPMLEHVVRRVASASRVDIVCVATTTLDRDDPVADAAAGSGAAVVRGSEADVLGRYAQAVRELSADLVVRITSDCPLIDPQVVDEMLTAREALGAHPVDCYCNTVERRFPRGLDTEIVPAPVLLALAGGASDPRAREHVTWELYQHPDRYRVVNHLQADGRDDSALRWTVDTPEDFDLMRRIFRALAERGPFGLAEVRALLEAHPDWIEINAHIEQKRT
jgi:spore coat polysaccharide biosynthesis protein SpsF